MEGADEIAAGRERDADDDGPELILVRCRLDGVGPLGVLVTWRPEPWPIWAALLRRLGPDNWLACWGPLPGDDAFCALEVANLRRAGQGRDGTSGHVEQRRG